MNSHQRLSLVTLLSFVGLVSFFASSLALQNLRTDSLPAYLYCDIASQFFSNGTVMPLAGRPTPEICGPPIYSRWIFTAIALIHFMGCITMYSQTDDGSSYGMIVKDKDKKTKVQNEEGYNAKDLTQNEKKKRILNVTNEAKRGCCNRFFDGFYFVHVIAIPALWFLFYILQAEAKVSAIFGAWALQVLLSFIKIAPILDAQSRWAPLALSVFTSLTITETVNLIWWGVYVIQVFYFDDTHRSGWLLSWWILVVVYAVILTWMLARILRNPFLRKDELAPAVLQHARISVLVLDSFYLWLTGFIVFMFVE